MKVHVKVFPIAGLSNKRQEFEVSLEEGSMSCLETHLEERLGVTPRNVKSLMFLHNGRGLDNRENAVFRDGDLLWLLPQISGG